MTYKEFLENKLVSVNHSGFKISNNDINKKLFDFQKDIVRWSVKLGKNTIFAMTGLGKTFMQCEYARIITQNEKINCLIVAPLAVSQQTIREAEKLNIEISNLRHKQKINKINIINYEQLEKVNITNFNCIILDESSILKNYSGKIKNQIIEMFKNYSYKLACTATPAPNDFMELGNHAEFIGISTRTEMLSEYFMHDSGDTQKWRLKKHAENIFWKWMASWAAILTKPSDLGYDDKLFDLPKLNIIHHTVKDNFIQEGQLFVNPAKTLNERRGARKRTIDERIKLAADLVNQSKETWLIWCNLNEEGNKLNKKIKNSIEIKGSDSLDFKEKSMLDFSDNKIKCLITKPKIAGHGMNWQNSHNMIFVGLSDSFEDYFQAIRRQYRFGQKKEVNVHIITSDSEINVIKNIQRKEQQAMQMIYGMVEHSKKYIIENIRYDKNYSSDIKNIKTQIPIFLKGKNHGNRSKSN